MPTGAAEDMAAAATAEERQACASRMGMRDLADFGARGATGYLSGVRVVWSQPAHIHSVALGSDGRLYGWGCGSDGRLGLRAFFGRDGAKRTLKCYVSTPSAVEALLGRRVVAAAAGRTWTFAIVAPDDGGGGVKGGGVPAGL